MHLSESLISKLFCCGPPLGFQRVHKGGVTGTYALKILASPKKGGLTLAKFFGLFDKIHRVVPRVVTQPKQ